MVLSVTTQSSASGFLGSTAIHTQTDTHTHTQTHNQVAALNRALQGMRSASAAVSIDQGLQGPHGESHGRGRRPYSLDQLLSFTKLILYINEGSLFFSL